MRPYHPRGRCGWRGRWVVMETRVRGRAPLRDHAPRAVAARCAGRADSDVRHASVVGTQQTGVDKAVKHVTEFHIKIQNA
ncbi:hypothetical protein HRbin30_02728 [bacterium HR30]|nr:hypothetical protein HRbin30_02728 [bacterium HR30]